MSRKQKVDDQGDGIKKSMSKLQMAQNRQARKKRADLLAEEKAKIKNPGDRLAEPEPRFPNRKAERAWRAKHGKPNGKKAPKVR